MQSLFNYFILTCLLVVSQNLFALKAGDKISDFTLPIITTAKGAPVKTLTLSNYTGKVVYLDFWASWCKPCRRSFPVMQKLQEKYKHQGLVVLTVNEDSEQSLAEIFLLDQSVTFASLFDKGGKVAGVYNLLGMPTSFLIDRKGTIKAVHNGFNMKKAKKIERQIKVLLAAP